LLLEGLGGTEEKWDGVVGVDAIAMLKQKGISDKEKDENFGALIE